MDAFCVSVAAERKNIAAMTAPALTMNVTDTADTVRKNGREITVETAIGDGSGLPTGPGDIGILIALV